MDVAIIAPVSPFDPRDGHRLAVLSDVHAVLDNRLRLGLITFRYEGERDTRPPLCEHQVVPADGGGGATRFVRGVIKNLPPSAERLYNHSAREIIRRALNAWRPPVVIIDDASVAGYVPLIRDLLPRSRVILRSHNVMNDVRLEQLRRTKGLTRPLISFDCARYLAFEKTAVEVCDEHWAITQADAIRMKELYRQPAGYLSVSIPLERYAGLKTSQGSANIFVHVGTVDFRRRADLGRFLQTSWPKVLQADANASLTLAGTVHGNSIPAPNVNYAGRVESDATIYRLGRFALNFQSTTGGVKLKTLTSLAAGRTLLSSPAGVEGLALRSGHHYWDIDTFLANPGLKNLLEDQAATQSLADAGREYVTTHHSRSALAQQFSRLMQGSC